jgi:putative ABC transport system substrate-binding protein
MSETPRSTGLLTGSLRELGWHEGKNVQFEYRYAGGDLNRISEFASELVRLKVDVIVAGPDNAAALAAKRATNNIPIVMVGVVDPIALGLVASLARSGGNVTGITWEVTREQAGKNLELLKESVPKASRVAVLRNPHDTTHTPYSMEAERAAKVLGVTIRFADMPAQSDKKLDDALNTVLNERANALLLAPYAFFTDRRHKIIKFAASHKLPAVYFATVFVTDGGLMSYGPNSQRVWRRAAFYVDRILKGANPADLPIEQPTQFDLAINLKAAQQIGITIPQNVLARADRVIK